jgi:predicted transcriptional regulator
MAAIRDEIFEKLKTIENEDFLNSILHLVQNVDKEGIYQFSDQQKTDIDESISQIEKGEYSSHEDVMKKYLK